MSHTGRASQGDVVRSLGQVTHQESKIPSLDEGSRTAVVVATHSLHSSDWHIHIYLYKSTII
jgi:hypothetical protein